MNSREKFLLEMEVSVISDNGDNNFVEPCLPAVVTTVRFEGSHQRSLHHVGGGHRLGNHACHGQCRRVIMAEGGES